MKIEFVLEKLNGYHPNIQFTHKIEENQKIMCLDVLVTRIRENKLEATVFRKETNIDLYINSHATHMELTCTHAMETGVIKESD